MPCTWGVQKVSPGDLARAYRTLWKKAFIFCVAACFSLCSLLGQLCGRLPVSQRVYGLRSAPDCCLAAEYLLGQTLLEVIGFLEKLIVRNSSVCIFNWMGFCSMLFRYFNNGADGFHLPDLASTSEIKHLSALCTSFVLLKSPVDFNLVPFTGNHIS